MSPLAAARVEAPPTGVGHQYFRPALDADPSARRRWFGAVAADEPRRQPPGTHQRHEHERELRWCAPRFPQRAIGQGDGMRDARHRRLARGWRVVLAHDGAGGGEPVVRSPYPWALRLAFDPCGERTHHASVHAMGRRVCAGAQGVEQRRGGIALQHQIQSRGAWRRLASIQARSRAGSTSSQHSGPSRSVSTTASICSTRLWWAPSRAPRWTWLPKQSRWEGRATAATSAAAAGVLVTCSQCRCCAASCQGAQGHSR